MYAAVFLAFAIVSSISFAVSEASPRLVDTELSRDSTESLARPPSDSGVAGSVSVYAKREFLTGFNHNSATVHRHGKQTGELPKAGRCDFDPQLSRNKNSQVQWCKLSFDARDVFLNVRKKKSLLGTDTS